ncbi:hypothetical protein ACWC9Q_10400 [Streptomyces sp. NPDC001142]
MTAGSLSPSDARRLRRRMRIGAACASTGVLLTAAAGFFEAHSLNLLSGLLIGSSYLVAEPWFVMRSERWHRVITFVPMVVYVVMLGTVAILAAAALPDDPALTGVFLISLWVFHMFSGPPEPTSFAVERLEGRLTWAAAFQVFAMACGTVGAVVCLTRLPVPERFEPVLVGTSLGAIVGLGAASMKVFSRVRKLATQLARNAQQMVRCLERLSQGAVTERCKLREASEDAWDTLDLTLRSKIETGFHVSGTFVIPAEDRRSLETLVKESLDNPGAPPHQDAVAQLNRLRDACRSKIDTVA